jgi:hypothetical protein
VKKLLPLLLIAVLFPLPRAFSQTDVLTQHNDNMRTGQNTNETVLTPSNVNAATFGKLFSFSVDGYIYAQPLYKSNVSISGNLHNVVYVATEVDSVYAFDADNTDGTTNPLWHVSMIDTAHGASVGETTFDVQTALNSDCTNVVPQVGITSTPVIDPSTGTMYVEAKSQMADGSVVHRLHMLDITSGAEKTPGPITITATVAGTSDGGATITFDPLHHLNRPGLLLVNGTVYLGYASHCDNGPYHGWLFAYSAALLTRTAAYVTTPNGVEGEGGIWMSGAGMAADVNGNIFTATGNGSFVNETDFGDTVLKLALNGNVISVADYFTPFNQASLDNGDLDLGSGGILLLPDQPGKHPHELLQAGKDGTIRLIDRDQMTINNLHYCSSCSSDPQIVQELPNDVGSLFGSPAYWNNTVYFWGAGDVLKSYNLQNGLIAGLNSSSAEALGRFPGPIPAISANGNTNGIVWAIDATQYGLPDSGPGPAVLHAYDATNVANEVYNSSQVGTRDKAGNAVKFTVPTIANGKVYVGTTTELDVFGLNPSALVSIAVTPANASVTARGTLQFTATGTYSDNSTQNLTNAATWSSTNTGAATISSIGVATGVAAGSTTIQATAGSINGSTALNVMANQPPSVISVTPNSGSGLGPQTFSYLYSDGSGYQNIYLVQTILNTTLSWPGSCGTMYIAASSSLYLMSDDGSSWMGPLTIGQSGTLQNSQCTLNAGTSSASGSGTNLTVNLTLTFQPGFTGLENNFMLADDVVNNLTSGFQNRGTWTLAPITGPSAVSVTPSSGSDSGPQTFSYLYSDTSGYQNIYLVQTILNTTLSWPGSCGTMYIAASSSLYLMSDDGSSWLGPLTIGQAGTLQNSQCTLNAGASSTSGSGTNLTVNVALTFQAGFTGLKNNFMLANDVVNNLTSGFQNRGTWTPVTAPSAVSVIPSSGSGSGPQTFSYLYSDSSGYQNIYLVQTILNSTQSWPDSCGTMYIAPSGSLYLMSDDGSNWMGPLTIGQPGTLQNSQCTLNAGASSASGSGTNLTVNLALNFQPSFTGPKSNFMLANDVVNNLTSGLQNRGSWTPNPVTAPSAVSVIPSSGRGSGPQTFSYLYSDSSGYQNIYLVQTILNTTANWPGSCGTMYIAASSSLYLMNDTGNSWMGPLTIGQPGTLQNSQCTLNAWASSASGSGTNLTVNLALTFQPAFTGSLNNFMLAVDVVNNLTSGFQNRGTWSPSP